jgi:hypothetical protein
MNKTIILTEDLQKKLDFIKEYFQKYGVRFGSRFKYHK